MQMSPTRKMHENKIEYCKRYRGKNRGKYRQNGYRLKTTSALFDEVRETNCLRKVKKKNERQNANS